MSGLGYLGIAYVVVWLGIVAFLFAVTRRQRTLEKRLDELRTSLERDSVK